MESPLRGALEGKSQADTSPKGISDRELESQVPKIVVVGIGGGGNNTIDRIASTGVSGVKMIATNTDKAHLSRISADKKIPIGQEITQGRGTGGYPEVGRRAAENSIERFREVIGGADLVFVACGLGGGTGTGAAPVVAQVGKEEGAVVTGVVTMPFEVENKTNLAIDGLNEFRQHADSAIVIDNNRLSDMAAGLPIRYAFTMADEVLTHILKGITETIMKPSLINLDFADVRSLLEGGQIMMVGTGESDSQDRARKAVKQALSCPLLGDVDYSTSDGVIMHVSGSDPKISEIQKMAEYIQEEAGNQTDVILGARMNPGLQDTLRVILLISGASSPHLLGPASDGGVKPSGEPERQKTEAPLNLNIERL
ncbi:MAG: cell division protein FtsZ [Hadesarchaea archaeon]|nr:cell division protein FtsZ [Hadesarchaea archaeon]